MTLYNISYKVYNWSARNNTYHKGCIYYVGNTTEVALKQGPVEIAAREAGFLAVPIKWTPIRRLQSLTYCNANVPCEGSYVPYTDRWTLSARLQPKADFATCKRSREDPLQIGKNLWYLPAVPLTDASLAYVCRRAPVCADLQTCVMSPGRMEDELYFWKDDKALRIAGLPLAGRQKYLDRMVANSIASVNRGELRVSLTRGGLDFHRLAAAFRTMPGTARISVVEFPAGADKVI